ncbi:MAG: amidinotransferase [Haliscomenobacter sp.]|nr:arginine deiminase-related protein [Haliscomenobacter sp.]MBK9489579.1 amidinotransferase [Haliscomenobacter sp.]
MQTILQTTDTVLMVRPAHFGFNEETAANNAFQVNDQSLSAIEIQEKAKAEFDAFVAKLRSVGVNVIVVEDTSDPLTPDAVFPNNWVTFHQDGLIITYPMFAHKRRLERREDVLNDLGQHYAITNHVRMEGHEAQEKYLEGTGSMILDRPNRLVYACLSPRTDPELLEEFSRITGYTPVLFHAVDGQGQDIYHTNVMMALGETFVVIVMDSIRDAEDKSDLLAYFDAAGKEVIDLSLEQMMSFAGNMLQVRNSSGQTFLVMSTQAYQSLTPAQIAQIEKHTQILHSPIDTIETYGGGSARCMMAEVFLPKV